MINLSLEIQYTRKTSEGKVAIDFFLHAKHNVLCFFVPMPTKQQQQSMACLISIKEFYKIFTRVDRYIKESVDRLRSQCVKRNIYYTLYRIQKTAIILLNPEHNMKYTNFTTIIW